MSSATGPLYGVIRNRLASYVPEGGDTPLSTTLANAAGVRIYTLEAPDNAVFPFIVLRLQNVSTGAGDDGALRHAGDLEAQVFARPRSALVTAEHIADRCAEALHKWTSNTVGDLFVRRMTSRDTMPPYPAPADRELVQVRLVWSFTWWAPHITQLAVPSGEAP